MLSLAQPFFIFPLQILIVFFNVRYRVRYRTKSFKIEVGPQIAAFAHSNITVLTEDVITINYLMVKYFHWHSKFILSVGESGTFSKVDIIYNKMQPIRIKMKFSFSVYLIKAFLIGFEVKLIVGGH